MLVLNQLKRTYIKIIQIRHNPKPRAVALHYLWNLSMYKILNKFFWDNIKDNIK